MGANVLFSGDGWRQFSYEEIVYLVDTRENAINLQGYATVNEVTGVVFLPDDWVLPEGMTFKPKSTTGYNANVYDVTQWTTMENAGAVFLPCGGLRNQKSIQNLKTHGFYQTSTCSNSSYGYFWQLYFQNNNINFQQESNGYGQSVRLIRETEEAKSFSIGLVKKIHFAKGNLQYRASDNTWKFAENQYDIIGTDNSQISPTNNCFIDLFTTCCTGWANGRENFRPYDICTRGTYGNYSAIGVYSFCDFGEYLCYLRDRQPHPNKFVYVRNPTLQNGITTLYVSKRGSDTLGDGSAEYPYASLAYVTNVGYAGCNIMVDDGEWSEARTLNGRVFNWWGNSNTRIEYKSAQNAKYSAECFFYLKLIASMLTITSNGTMNGRYENCLIYGNITQYVSFYAKNCIIIDVSFSSYMEQLLNCVLIRCRGVIGYSGISGLDNTKAYMKNCLCYNCTFSNNTSLKGFLNYNNYCNTDITSIEGANTINDQITGQTILDYFNFLPQSIIDNPLTEPMEDWLKCDFTAKEGSANIGAGEKGTTIGLNQGYTMYADNSVNDVFSPDNGAVLKNVQYNSSLNGYTLIQKECIAKGGTSSTIILDDDASSVDDYYNNLFVGIVGGEGYGEMFLITDYDGATHTATIDGTWTTTPTTSSVYTISGTIQSAIKDFGKVIKVKRNWLFADMTPLNDGRWSEFLTHVTSDGKQFPVNSYSYEYSIDGTNWYQGETDYDLISATDGENKVYNNVYGDCSSDFNEEEARRIIMRYIKMTIHIGFNIGEEDVE